MHKRKLHVYKLRYVKDILNQARNLNRRSLDKLGAPSQLLGVRNLGSDNSLKWPQTDNRQYTLEARYVIFIKNFTVFVRPKPGRKYSHTNSHICAVTAITQDDHRSQLELGPAVIESFEYRAGVHLYNVGLQFGNEKNP